MTGEEFVVLTAGTAGRALDNIDKAGGYSGVFFQPGDLPVKALTVVSAPVLNSVFSLIMTYDAIEKLITGLYELATIGKEEGLDTLSKAGSSALVALFFAIHAVLSPFINLVDLIGSGVTSITNPEPTYPQFNM
ncbi:MAG: hypothetical protein EPN84_04815 [Legionella sp.]|nr:MAG: hypothetical protein EPN84_04815 [Legionella sp.]